MSLSVTVTAGKRFTSTELVDNAKLNQLAVPTAAISGSASSDQLANISVTSTKTKVGPHFNGANNGSAVNDYRVTTNATLTDGTVEDGTMIFFEVAAATNTAASTFKADTMTARNLVKRFNVALVAGDLRVGQHALVIWHAATTTWELLSLTGNPDVRKVDAISADGLAYSGPSSPTMTALTNGALVLVKWATTNTGAVTFALDGLAATAVRKLNNAALAAGDLVATQVSALMYDSTLGNWMLLSPTTPASTRATVPVRQTVLTGPVDTNGHPVLLTYSGQAVTLKATSSSPLVVTFAAGMDDTGALDYVARYTSDVPSAWTISTTNATYYLYVDRDASTGTLTYGSTSSRPLYITDDAAATAPSGLHTFLINEMKMYYADGATAAAKQRVFIGECVVSGGAITSVTSYMFRGLFQSSADQTIAANNTDQAWTETHKLGLNPVGVNWVLVCQSADLNYAQYDEVPVECITAATGGYHYAQVTYQNATTLGLRVPWGTILMVAALVNKTAYTSDTGITAANWKLRAYAWRGW